MADERDLLDSVHEIRLGETDTRSLDATPLVVAMWAPNVSVVLAVDQRRNVFVRLHRLHDGSRRVVGLSPDGRHLLVVSDSEHRYPCVGMEELASGTCRWFDRKPSGVQDRVAAISPNGQTIAVLSTELDPADIDASFAVISLVDTASGERHRLWAAGGGWSAETAIGWSPDQQHVAATYFDADEQSITVVIDLEGVERHRIELAAMSPPSGEAWLGDQELLYLNDATWILGSLCITDGSRRPRQSPYTGIPLARVGDRFVWEAQRASDDPTRLVTTQLDRNDARPFLIIGPPGVVYRVDSATNLVRRSEHYSRMPHRVP